MVERKDTGQTDFGGPRGVKRKFGAIDPNGNKDSGYTIKRLRRGRFDSEQIKYANEQANGPFNHPPVDTFDKDGKPTEHTHFAAAEVEQIGAGSIGRAYADDASNAMDIQYESGTENYGSDFDEDELAQLHQVVDQAQKLASDEKLLISDGPVRPERPKQISFLTRDQHEKKYGRRLEKDELDARAVLIRDDVTGSYLPKIRVYTKMLTEEGGHDQFNALMDELGLSQRPFNEGLREVPIQDRFYDTPAGIRERRRLFKYPLQAGEENPDLLLRNSEGEFIGIYPKLEGVERLSALTDHYGIKNVWLKTSGNVYKTPEVYNSETKVRPQRTSNDTIDVAQMAFARFTNQIYEVKRDDLPKVLVRLGTGVYASKAHYDATLKGWEMATWQASQLNNSNQIELRPKATGQAELMAELNKDLFRRDVLILAPNGAGYISPRVLRDEYPEAYFEKTMRDANLPEELADVRSAAAPELLVRKNNKVFVAGEDAMKEAKEQGRTLRDFYSDGHIIVQRRDELGRFTGKFDELDFCLKAGKPLSEAQVEQLALDPKQTLHTKLESVKPDILIRLRGDRYVSLPEYDRAWRYRNLDGGRAKEPDAAQFDVLLLDRDEKSYLSPGEVRELSGERAFGQIMHRAGLPQILADKPPLDVPTILVQISADNFVSSQLLKVELEANQKPLQELYPPSDIFLLEHNRNSEVKFTDLQSLRERTLVSDNLANELNKMTIHDPNDRSAQNSLRGLGKRAPPFRTAFGR